MRKFADLFAISSNLYCMRMGMNIGIRDRMACIVAKGLTIFLEQTVREDISYI